MNIIMDTLVRGTSMDGSIRVISAVTTDIVNEAVRIHNTYPVATAAMGRLLTAAAIMGATFKNESDTLTLQIKGDGPLQSIVAVGDAQSRVRGYVANPYVDRPLNDKGKLDVGGAIGQGFLTVIRDLGLKEPYIGQTPLVSGEIAEDISYYYAQSEQIPTAIGLGVLVDVDNTVISAGGFMIQMLPGSTDEMAQKLNETLKNLPAVSKLIKDGTTAEDLFFSISEGFDMLMDNNFVVPKYECKCSKDRMEEALVSIGEEELNAIIEEQGEAELTCHFCDNKYKFSKEELQNLLKRAK